METGRDISRVLIRGWILGLAVVAAGTAAAADRDRRHGIGIGLARGTYETDLPDRDRVTLDGRSVFGKLGITTGWGLLVTHRELEVNDDVPGTIEASHTLTSIHVLRMWRAEWQFRPHVKLGVARTRFESRFVQGGTFVSEKITPAFGLGFEWGSPRLAFFFDGEWIYRRMELAPGLEESSVVGSTSIGLIYKF